VACNTTPTMATEGILKSNMNEQLKFNSDTTTTRRDSNTEILAVVDIKVIPSK